MKINNFRGDVTDFGLKEPLLQGLWGHCLRKVNALECGSSSPLAVSSYVDNLRVAEAPNAFPRVPISLGSILSSSNLIPSNTSSTAPPGTSPPGTSPQPPTRLPPLSPATSSPGLADFSGSKEPKLAESVCRNVVLSVAYTVVVSTSGLISNVVADVVLGDVAAQIDGTFETRQSFSVVFRTSAAQVRDTSDFIFKTKLNLFRKL